MSESGSNHRERRLPGKVAIAVAMTTALIALAWMAIELSPSGEHSPCFRDSGIISEIPPHEPGPTYTRVAGGLQIFPPGRECFAYEIAVAPDGSDELIQVASKTYPDPTSYLWIALLVSAPLLVSFGWRNFRRAPGTVPTPSSKPTDQA